MPPQAVSRRSALRTTLGAAIAFGLGPVPGIPRLRAAAAPALVMTVRGPVPAAELGPTLPHEHVTTDFLGAEKLPAPRYDRDLAFETVRPEFEALRQRGVRCLVECTPAYIGRDVRLLRRLSEATGLHVLTNTGYYGAADDRYLPRHAHTESEQQLADRWLAEWRDGIEGTGIRPGFIKLGTGSGRLPPHHQKLVRAACRVHRESGLTIAIHTGDGEAARDELRILTDQGIAPGALIWVHAQNDPGPAQADLARRGVWISLDGYNLGTRNPERYRNLVLALKKEDLLGRVLLSHDDGWAVEGDAATGATLKLFGNGNPLPYRSLLDRGRPDLRDAGVTDAEWRTLTETNPAAALAVRTRLT